jgi:phosphoenolpyruvate-protein phosphotransferase (PTS system enzyme I)
VERLLRGIPASPGIAAGTAHVLRWEVPEVPARMVPEAGIPAERARLDGAIQTAIERLRRVRERAERNAGPEEAAIFDVQVSILEDPQLRQEIDELIAQGIAAEKAVDLVLLEWRQHFARHQHAMLREREGDVKDVHIRVLSILLGLPDHDPVDVRKGARAILVTHDLTPSLTVQLDREAILAIATEEGTRTSHVAILARSLGLPALVGVRGALSALRGGESVILDGTAGTLVVGPTEDELTEATARDAAERSAYAALSGLRAAEAVTADGVALTLRANVDLPEEAKAAAATGATGVGLMRTEFLVVGRATMPDEDEQVREYRAVLEAFRGQPVIIRTYDIGGDKLPVGGFPSEPNPFLGWRAIRMCLDQPEIFDVQLRALLRAAVDGDLRIMLPLVTGVDEVRAVRARLAAVAAALAGAGVPHRADVPVGVMIETPAAAVAADTFVGVADFFSIGTNDLTQYMLAVDRGNAALADRFQPLHPAVLRLMREVVRAGAAGGIDVGVCGELASDPLGVYALLGLGVRQFSVTPRALLGIKQVVRAAHVAQAAAAADAACAASTAAAAEQLLREALRADTGHHA